MAKTKPFNDHFEEYEEWFKENPGYYESELKAIQRMIQNPDSFVEIGVGSGLFAAPLGIKLGIEPSRKMADAAKKRGIEVLDGTGENLPLGNESVSGILMVTTICFLDDPEQTLRECFRVLKPNGKIVIAFVDRESPIGKEYMKLKNQSVFYKDATFFSSGEIISMLEKAGFKHEKSIQTLFPDKGPKDIHPIKDGYGNGSFVVISAIKQ